MTMRLIVKLNDNFVKFAVKILNHINKNGINKK